jgi:hypothetical protein
VTPALARFAWVALPAAIVLGVVLRLVPCWNDPSFDFVVDAGYHERLIRSEVAAGHLPDVDPLSNAPEGRRTANELPIGLYTAGAFAVRALGAVGEPKWALAWLVALCGVAIAFPVWLGTRAAFGSADVARLAAAASVLIPTHLERSYGYWLRYDAPGTLLVATHVAMALAALASGARGRRIAWAIGSGVALFAAIATWRVTFIVVGLEFGFVLWRLVHGGADEALRDTWAATVLATCASIVAIPYLAELRHGAGGWIAVISALPVLGLGVASRGVRWGVFAATIAAVIAAIALGGGGGEGYATLPALIGAKAGLGGTPAPPLALMLEVQELYSVAPWRLLFDPQLYFVLGAWLVASPFLFAWIRRGRPVAGAVNAAPALLAFVTAGLVAMTLMFVRTSVLLAPFLVMVLGGLAARLLSRDEAPESGAAEAKPRAGRRAKRGASARAMRSRMAVALGVSAAWTCALAATQAFGTFSRLSTGERETLAYLVSHSRPDAIVAAPWDEGYDVQNAGRRTVVDGLLESVPNRLRIVELDDALMARDPAVLANWCARRGATWLLLSPPTAVQGIAAVAGDPIAEKIKRGDALTPGPETDHVVIHLMLADSPMPGFTPAFDSGGYRLYRVGTASH